MSPMRRIRRLSMIVQRIFRPVHPVERIIFKVKEPTKSATDLQDYYNPFLDLPNELLLVITNFLEKEHQVVLSHSCRQLRVLLNSSLDLSLTDLSMKLRFLQCLVLDYPDYLTCRSCGFLFKWKTNRMRLSDYRCPRVFDHPPADRLTLSAWCMQGDPNIWVTLEVIDLIFRAHERGQRHGLHLSFLSTSGSDRDGITRTNEPRLVDGQLMLASRWEVGSESGQDLARNARYFNSALCLHWALNVWCEKIWQPVEQAVASMTGLGVFKCPFCETDHELSVQNGTGNQMKVVLKVWRNYGRRCGNTLASEKMFHTSRPSRIDADTLSQRDLQALFESDENNTDSVRV